MPAFDTAFANVLGTLSGMEARRAQARHEDERLKFIKDADAYQRGRDVPLGVLQEQWETQIAESNKRQKDIEALLAEQDAIDVALGADWKARLTAGVLQGKSLPEIFASISSGGEMQGPPAPEADVAAPVTADTVRSTLFGTAAPETMGFPSGFGAKSRLPAIMGEMQGPPAPPMDPIEAIARQAAAQQGPQGGMAMSALGGIFDMFGRAGAAAGRAREATVEAQAKAAADRTAIEELLKNPLFGSRGDIYGLLAGYGIKSLPDLNSLDAERLRALRMDLIQRSNLQRDFSTGVVR